MIMQNNRGLMKGFMTLVITCLMSGALAQSNPCDNKYGTDSVTTVKNLSLFNQYFQQKDYVAAFPYWYYLFNNAPCVVKRITYNGPYIIKKAARDPKYKARQWGLIDTIMLVHQKRIELFGDRNGYVKAKWANDLSDLNYKQRDSALMLFRESVAQSGMDAHYNVPGWYVESAVKELKQKRMELDSVLVIYDQMSAIIQHNLKKGGKKLEKWKEAEKEVNNEILPYLDCDKLIAVRKPQVQANPEDLDLLKSTLNLLDRIKCDDRDFYLQLAEKLYGIEPNVEAAQKLAKGFKSKKEYSKALMYYEKAAEGAETKEEKIELYYNLAVLSLSQSKLSDTRTYARKILEFNPNEGRAYLVIGDAYAQSYNSCKGLELGGNEVFWAAVDKYYKAKSVDPSVAETAQEKINKYSQYFPDKETAFFKGVTDGNSYTVGCWIGETTTVRTRSSQ